MVAPGATGATTPYFSPQTASGAEKMNSVCCCSPATLVLSGYVTSGALWFCVLALPGVTFSVSVCTSGGSAARGVWWCTGGNQCTDCKLSGEAQSKGGSYLC